MEVEGTVSPNITSDLHYNVVYKLTITTAGSPSLFNVVLKKFWRKTKIVSYINGKTENWKTVQLK